MGHLTSHSAHCPHRLSLLNRGPGPSLYSAHSVALFPSAQQDPSTGWRELAPGHLSPPALQEDSGFLQPSGGHWSLPVIPGQGSHFRYPTVTSFREGVSF